MKRGWNIVLLDLSNREEYEQFIEGVLGSSINQSLYWGVMQERVARESVGMVVTDSKGVAHASALITKHKLPFGYTYLYINSGPIFNPAHPELFEVIMKHVDSIAKEFKSLFVRVDPAFLVSQHNQNAKDVDDILLGFGRRIRPTFFKERGFVEAHATYQPHDTLVIDLRDGEEKILSNMKSKGRYNIKLAQKKGVTTKVYWDDGEHVDRFVELMRVTTARDGFSGHPTLYYKTMMEFLGPRKQCALILAEYEGEVIAGAMETFYGKKATYYYGASDNKYRNVMSPYLLQWKMIELGMQMNCDYYDFLGIAPLGDKEHRFAKITEFKEKFGGHRVEYIGAWEKVYIQWMYDLMLFAKRMRGLLRR